MIGFVFLLMLLIAKSFGKIISRFFCIIFLILFFITYTCLGILYGKNNEFNANVFLIIIFGAFCSVSNLIGIILINLKSFDEHVPCCKEKKHDLIEENKGDEESDQNLNL